jgi:hypothetical protein
MSAKMEETGLMREDGQYEEYRLCPRTIPIWVKESTRQHTMGQLHVLTTGGGQITSYESDLAVILT